MGFWWFGRKSAPADMRPFVPAWLNSAEAEVGFARSADRVNRRNSADAGLSRACAGRVRESRTGRVWQPDSISDL